MACSDPQPTKEAGCDTSTPLGCYVIKLGWFSTVVELSYDQGRRWKTTDISGLPRLVFIGCIWSEQWHSRFSGIKYLLARTFSFNVCIMYQRTLNFCSSVSIFLFYRIHYLVDCTEFMQIMLHKISTLHIMWVLIY